MTNPAHMPKVPELHRYCSVCGEKLPAGKVFHVPHCADMHRAEIAARYEEAREQRLEEARAGWTRRIKHTP